MSFVQQVVIRWADLDPNGHVRHSVYYDFGAQVRLAFLERHGVGLSWLAGHGVGPVLFREEAKFRRELRLGDELTIDFQAAGLSPDGRKWRARHELVRGGELAASIDVEGAWLDLRTRKIVVPPPELARAFGELTRTADFAVLGRAAPLARPALDPAEAPARTGSGYPEPFRSRVLPREKRALGDALGLTQIGVNLTTLGPGAESSMRHHHSHEDELVFVLEGEVVLRTDRGEQVLTSGMCAGFPARSGDGHQLVNRSGRPARYLEISNRDARDSAVYPDVDLVYAKDADGKAVYTHKDGTPYDAK